jgi:hypothetical protein
MTASDTAPADAARPRANVIVRHWRGELPLWVSYWVIGFGGTFAARLAILAVETWMPRAPLGPEAAYAAEVALGWAIALTVAVWQVVGTWRSATRYAAARRAAGRRPVWSTLAKAVMVLSVLATLVQAARIGLPQAIDVYDVVVLGDPDVPPFDIRVMRRGREAEFTGGIRLGAAEALRKTLDHHPNLSVLHLSSVGGRFSEAEQMLALVRARGLVTYVPASCESACTLVFAAGRERWIAPDAAIGFHSPSFGAFDAFAAEEGAEAWRDALVGAGYERAFVERGIAVPAGEMWYPTHEELAAARVTTHTADGSQFAVSGYGGSLTRADVEPLGEEFPAFLTLQQKAPAAFEEAADVILAAYDAGRTPREIVGVVRAAIGPALVAHAPDADDDVLLDYSIVSTALLEEIRAVSSGLCYLAATGGDFDVTGTRYVGDDVRAAEWEVIERAIDTAALRPAVSDAALAGAVERLEAVLAERLDPRRRALLAANIIRVEQEDDFCAAVIALGRSIGALPSADAVAILRRLTLARRDGKPDEHLPIALQRHFLVQ